MRAYDGDKSETIKDIKRIERNLRDRVNRIEEREDLPQMGVESFRKFEARLGKKLDDKTLRELSAEEIQTIHRDISYLNNLKTLSIKGAEKARDIYLPVKEKIDVLSIDMRKKFWDTYNKLLENYALMDRFKYEILETISNYMYSGEAPEDIVDNIIDLYDETLTEVGEDATDRKIRLSFTEKLENLFS